MAVAKRGWLTTVNIAGRPYLTDKHWEFLRGRAGEFAKSRRTPKRFGPVHKSSPPAAEQASPFLAFEDAICRSQTYVLCTPRSMYLQLRADRSWSLVFSV